MSILKNKSNFNDAKKELLVKEPVPQNKAA
jgi:hypothetical protein